ncbi:unnamed protein product [Camellia sinensis]
MEAQVLLEAPLMLARRSDTGDCDDGGGATLVTAIVCPIDDEIHVRSDGPFQDSSAEEFTPPNEATATLSPPPMKVNKVEKLAAEASPAPISNPRRSSVVSLFPYNGGGPTIKLVKSVAAQSMWSPSPSPAATDELLSGFTTTRHIVRCAGKDCWWCRRWWQGHIERLKGLRSMTYRWGRETNSI